MCAEKTLISIVVPCYNEEKTIPVLYTELCKVMKTMFKQDFEVIFVDDGSRDNTISIIRNLAQDDNRIKYISFSRNFGKEAAIYAGFEHAKGDYVAMMDADMQDPPALLHEMYHWIAEEGYDSVATRRVNRVGEPPIRSFFARQFYKLMNKISNVELVDGARDYRLMNRKFLNALLQLKEYNRFSKGLYGWVGFKTKWLEFENVERVAGETKWSFWALVKYSIEGIVAFSTDPLLIASIIGIFMCFFSVIFIVFIIARKLIFGDPVAGWPSLVCIMSLIAGIQMLVLGIVGQYIAKMYMEIKNRPIYIIGEDNLFSQRNAQIILNNQSNIDGEKY